MILLHLGSQLIHWNILVRSKCKYGEFKFILIRSFSPSLDYLQCIDTPMDLRTVKEDLLGGNYESADDFVKDMRLIFANSRNYNTNKRSRVRISNEFY